MGTIKKIQDMKYEMTRWRQKLHAEPELAFEETATARFLARQLQSFGMEVHALTKTGVIGVLHGKHGSAAETGGKSIMLRADMDALPIKEETGAPYASNKQGVHHACGHDGHMAMLLGAAKHLAQTKDFEGTVYFLFQPAEEHIGGAKELIKQGLFEKFPCDEIYGLHNYPGLPLGVMATGAGDMLAASDEVHVTFSGKGGHTSKFEDATDVIGAMAEAIHSMKQMAQKEIHDGTQAVLAISSVNSSSQAANILPDSVYLQGSIRSFDSGLQENLRKNVEEIAREAALKYAADVTVEFKNGYPVLVNSPAETGFAAGVAKDVVGDDKVITSVPRIMGVEDFAYYLQKKPGNFMAIGTGKNDGKGSPDLHTARYDFNDAALPIGASYWVSLVEKALPLFNAPPASTPPQDAPRL